MAAIDVASPPVASRHVKHALAYMRGNLHEKISLSDIAVASGVSKRTLLRQFERVLGVPPLVHLHRLRLVAARDELLKPGCTRPITEIAVSCGLAHPGRFSADYRCVFGESPSETRRRVAPRPATYGAMVAMRDRPSLAIQPLRTETLEERREAQDVVEQMAASLSRTQAASVMRGRPAGAPSHRPEARYTLGGRLALRGARMRITLCLVDNETGRHVWGDSYDGSAEDAFVLQDRVVEGVMGGVLPGITHAEIERCRDKPPENRVARDLVLQALPTAMKMDAGSARSAFATVSRAMELDPDNALAMAVAAYAQARISVSHDGDAIAPHRELARRLAQRADVVDSGDARVTAARAGVAGLLGQHDDADALSERAIATDPTLGWAWERRGFSRLNVGGDPDLAIKDFLRALRLHGATMPRDNCFNGLAQAHRTAGRVQEAIIWLRKGLAENPRAALLVRLLACYATRLGDRATAQESVERLRRLQPHLTLAHVVEALPALRDDCHDYLARAGLPL